MSDALKEELWSLIVVANAHGRGRIDSRDWEVADLEAFHAQFESIWRRLSEQKREETEE